MNARSHDGSPVRILLVGIGGYGTTYVTPLLDGPAEHPVRIVGAVDPAPERCPRLEDLRRRDVPLFGSLADFYRAVPEGADLALISSPIQMHSPQTCQALENGTNVLCEKPIAATVQETEEMIRTRDRTGRWAAIGYQWSYSAATHRLKRDIQAGLFGRPVRLSTLVLWPRRWSYYQRNGWAGRLRDGDGRWVLDSPMNNATSHYLHNMLFVLGDRRDSSVRLRAVQAELYRAYDIESCDTAALRARTEDGTEVLFFTTHAVADRVGPVYRYEFESAEVRNDGPHGEITAYLRDGTTRAYGSPDETRPTKLWEAVAAVRGGPPLACPLEAAAVQTRCINGAHDSVDEIARFPADLVHETHCEGDRQRWVEGLAELFTRSYEQSRLPAELGTSWGRLGRVIDLANYHRYPSRTGGG